MNKGEQELELLKTASRPTGTQILKIGFDRWRIVFEKFSKFNCFLKLVDVAWPY